MDAMKPTTGQDTQRHHRIIGQSPAFMRLMQLVERFAPTDKAILITGPTGAGKEVVAQEVHRRSLAPDQPFIDLNCGAIPEHLMEAELFGHARGAFTGAQDKRAGLLARVGQGTLFLDEIGELPLSLQPKLLRVLETRTFRPLGASQSERFEGRVIAATHRDLQTAVREGSFREDLYYRLSVFVLNLPGLEQRKEDIPALVGLFSSMQPRPLHFSPEAMQRLMASRWPGNVRQLRSLIDRLGVLSDDALVTEDQLDHLLEPGYVARNDLSTLADALLALPGEDKLAAAEALLLDRALQLNRGNKTAAARMLGVGRKVVERRLALRGDKQGQLLACIEEGARCMEQSRFQDALEAMHPALALLNDPSLQREARTLHFRLLAQLGVAYSTVQGWSSGDALSCYETALAIGKELGSEVDIDPILFGIWSTQLMSLELDKARHTAQQMLQRSLDAGKPGAVADAHFVMANTLFWLGDHAEVLACLERGGLLDMTGQQRMGTQGFDLQGLVRTFEGLSAFQLGQYPRARQIMSALAIQHENDEGQAFSRAIALQGAAWLACLFEDHDSMGRLGRELETLSAREGFAFYQGIGQFFRGCHLASQGEYDAAETAMTEGYQQHMLRHGGKLFHSFQAWKRSELLLDTGRATLAAQIASHALDLAIAQKERAYMGELMIVRARAQWAQGDLEEAEHGLRSALTMAEALGVLPARIAAASHLARLLAEQGRQRSAGLILTQAMQNTPADPHPLLQRTRMQWQAIPDDPVRPDPY